MSTANSNSNEHTLSDLTGFRRDLLVVIAGNGPDVGLKLKDALAAARAEHVNHGRFYPNIQALVDLGLVSKTEVDGRTNHYAITQRGRDQLAGSIEWQITNMEDSK